MPAREVQRLDDLLPRDRAAYFHRLREHDREIRRPVAERGIARALEHRLDVLGRTERLRGSRELGAKQIGGDIRLARTSAVPDEALLRCASNRSSASSRLSFDSRASSRCSSASLAPLLVLSPDPSSPSLSPPLVRRRLAVRVLAVIGEIESRALEVASAPPETRRVASLPHSGHGSSATQSLIFR